MDSKEYNFNEALKHIKANPYNKEDFLSFSGTEQEGQALLEIAKKLYSIPKNEVPQPLLRRKYILSTQKKSAFIWAPFSKLLTAGISSLLLVSSCIAIGLMAYTSVPGQKLFTLKHASEQIQLKFTMSEEAKVNLQLQIAQKRLNEAQKVLNDPSIDPRKEKAVLNELITESKNSINTLNQAAKNNTLNQINHPLVASAETLNKQQAELLNTIKADEELDSVTKDALVATKENLNKITEIKNYIAIAGNEASLTFLDPESEKVSMTGSLTKLDKNSITVEQTEFILIDSTIIMDSEGKSLNTENLQLGNKINVQGKKEESKIIARKILILLPEIKTEIKGEFTNVDATVLTSTSTPESTTSPESQKNIAPPRPEPTPQSMIEEKSTVSSFILEDPSPQTNFNQ